MSSVKVTDNTEQLAQKIINEHEEYKKALAIKKNQSVYKKLPNDEKENVDKLVAEYQDFISTLKNIVDSQGLTESVVTDFAKSDGYAQAVASTVTFNRTQLRKLFNQIRHIELAVKREGNISKMEVSLAKIHALLAYAKGRGLIDEHFYGLINTMIKKVRESKEENTFKNFIDIFESIVAYHVYYNPSNQ